MEFYSKWIQKFIFIFSLRLNGQGQTDAPGSQTSGISHMLYQQHQIWGMSNTHRHCAISQVQEETAQHPIMRLLNHNDDYENK